MPLVASQLLLFIFEHASCAVAPNHRLTEGKISQSHKQGRDGAKRIGEAHRLLTSGFLLVIKMSHKLRGRITEIRSDCGFGCENCIHEGAENHL